jgi:hypothetical protein
VRNRFQAFAFKCNVHRYIEEFLAAQKQRRLETRLKAVKEAVLVRPESTRQFHAFAAMMKRWRYWDQDYARLHEMHARWGCTR